MKTVISVLAASALVFALPAFAGPAPAQPAATAFHVGKLSLVSLSDATFSTPNDGKIFGGDAGPAAVADVLKAAHAPTDTITLSVDALLVRDGARLVLIDTGFGAKMGGALTASLKLAGVTPDQITDVLVTHAHGDHIGGLLDASGQPAFPKAKVRLSSADWTYLQGQDGMADMVKAIAPQVATFEPGAQVTPSITAIAIKGHTPGHVGYQIVSGKDRLLDIGDTAHSSIISLAKPDWTMGFDSDAAVAKASRRETLTELAKDHERVFAPHFPYPGVGTVVASGDGFAWQPADLTAKPGKKKHKP
ncbi:MBL fold metallo-hydrolase [Asticcacaulis solisilvae]|uniref:MBL fold metallo-hydrolase n=1 Tax=Asticcacaulis solisilvae TaxID=1217274 RepID=UPI003FD802B7